MKFIYFMLGNGLLKKENKMRKSKMSVCEKESRRLRKKNSIEVFLRQTLGTRLIEKKF